MKSALLTIPLAVLGLLIIGCRHPTTSAARAVQAVSLTAEAATAIASNTANEKAQTLYNCRPFVASRTAEFVDGQWLWYERQPRGVADLEATVRLAPDGTLRTCDVILLDIGSTQQRLFRR